MSKRPKRRVTIKSEVPIKILRKWKDKEMETLLSSVMRYGHKNLEKIQENLPERSIENIKTFLRTVHDTAGKLTKQNEFLDIWIKYCDTLGRTPWTDCIQIAQVLKYLSIDGLLEYHPLPERCQGIDFRQAYRLLYEAMMGYPLQPVNKATAEFVLEALAELSGEVKKQTDAIKNVDLFILNNSTNEPQKPAAVSSKPLKTSDSTAVKKQAKVYQKKKPTSLVTGVSPSLKIVVKESPGDSNSDSGCLKDFSVTVEGKDSCQSTTVNVPVACEEAVDENELELLKSPSYNPFKIPRKWLEEPLYLNLIQSL